MKEFDDYAKDVDIYSPSESEEDYMDKMWESYLKQYADATVKDLKLSSSEQVVDFIKDYYESIDDTMAEIKEKRQRKEEEKKVEEKRIKTDIDQYEKEYPNQLYSISSAQKSPKFNEWVKKEFGIENYDPVNDDDDESNIFRFYLDYLYDTGDVKELKNIQAKNK